jgi:phosphoglycerate dehydrogenase-like enzyme
LARLRVGYPAALPVELAQLLPLEAELIAIPTNPESEIAVDFWIPPPAGALGEKIWPHLRGVTVAQSMMAGTEWLTDLVGPTVTVCNAQGAHSISTAEWTMAAILATLKYLPLYRDLQHKGEWCSRKKGSAIYAELHHDQRPQFPPIMQEELHGKRVLIVGYGDIGKTIERMLEPFGVEITRVARSVRAAPQVHAVSELDVLLPHAEIVILILPLTPESQGLIGAKQLALMPQGALLINAARGPIVQTSALIDALNGGHIRAAIDVTDPEPLPGDHPLWNCPNLLITPHVAGSTPQFSPRAIRIAADQIRRVLSGQPLINVVQQGVGQQSVAQRDALPQPTS